MFQKVIRFIGGDPNKRDVNKLIGIIDEINELEKSYEALSDDELRGKTDEFRQRLAKDEILDDLLPEAFAAVREASKRTNEQRPFDVQLIGGIVLHQGKIAEMRTGEGKTLAATLPLYLNALAGKGVHLVTVNDYLARRDARWMAPIYNALGMSVGVLQMAARTENGRNAFLVDLEKKSPHEDQDQLRVVLRKEAYQADITYGTNSEYGFDYLRDNLTMSLEERVQRGHYFAIVDEVDNILIDEARTPLIISGPASDDTEWYLKMAQVVRQLNPEDYEISEKDRTVSLTEIGEAHVEQILDIPLRDPERPEDITPEQARLFGYLEQSLRAQFLFRRNKDYLVQAGKVVIVDEFTGRLMPGRRWSDGLHQAVEAKESVKVEPENVTYATITLQNYFRMYAKLCGMTGTALTEAEEFYKIYKLDVLPIPTNLEYQTIKNDSPLAEIDAKDEQGYKYSYFARRGDLQKKVLYFRRKDYPDVVYRSEEAKLRAISKEIIYYYIKGRPQLVGTTSVEHSERLSERLHADPLRRLLQTMLIRKIWLEKNNREADERAIPELKPLYRSLEEIQAGELRQMAKPLGLISINPEDDANFPHILELLELSAEDKPRLQAVLQGGVPHQVLNARKHDEESQIIAGAGAFGAVTIATNMAGRGVDIKLGGDLPEEVLAGVNRILARTGQADPYDMTMDQREQALRALKAEDYGIYDTDAATFLQYMDDMRAVRRLGGLHVIGSERHEARRIDNQLRGRAARQGDPGSSRFYLALDDELMRLFGGGQVEGLMARLNIDEAVPIESGIVGRLVEQSQTRVEGANFDVRKHLLEYDDVLNTQRHRIYGQRDMVFTKEELSEDVTEMLRTELAERIPKALKDEEGPWKLLAYLEEIQPPLDFPGAVFPSYPFQLLINSLGKYDSAASLRASLVDLAERAFKEESDHILRSFRTILEKSEDTIQAQLQEREEALDNYMESLKEGRKVEEDEENPAQPTRPQDMISELSGLVVTPLKLSPAQLRALTSDDTHEVAEDIRAQIKTSVSAITTNRIITTFERRLEEGLGVKAAQFHQSQDWHADADALLQAAETVLENRRAKLLGDQGAIAHDLDANPARLDAALSDQAEQVRLLGLMSQGARVTFDPRTHQRVRTVTTRLRYVYLAAQLVEASSPQQITEDILTHLEEAQEKMTQMWGLVEWNHIDPTITTVGSLDAYLLKQLEEAWENLDELRGTLLNALSPENQQTIIEAMGWHTQSSIYRQLLLGVISDLWVDYLTNVEALRVSIGLEAYAQRDPLVMYKGRASEMFKELLSDIRAGVISRMFVYRPRPVSPAPEKERIEALQPAPAGAAPAAGQLPTPAGVRKPHKDGQAASTNGQPALQPGGGKKKRKRH